MGYAARLNPAHEHVIRQQAQQEAARAIARSFRAMPLWKRLKLAFLARWY